MTPVEWTTVAGTISAVLSTIFLPLYFEHRKQKRIEAGDARRDANQTEVSWEAMNRALVKERDKAEADLERGQHAWDVERQDLQERHRAEMKSAEDEAANERRQLIEEIARSKQRSDADVLSLQARLTESQKQKRDLYGELYELQKRLRGGGPADAPPTEP